MHNKVKHSLNNKNNNNNNKNIYIALILLSSKRLINIR